LPRPVCQSHKATLDSEILYVSKIEESKINFVFTSILADKRATSNMVYVTNGNMQSN